MRLIVGLAFLFPLVAAAQSCDLTLSMQYRGAMTVNVVAEYKGITRTQAQDIVKRSQSVLDMASKQQDKGGPDSIVFGGDANGCGINMPQVVTSGLKRNNASQVWHKAMAVGDETIKLYGGN